jgi:ABC-2 type transport system permease protein
MNWKHFAALVKARTMEFVRDRGSLFWNIFFPVLLVVGFAFVFPADRGTIYKVGVLGKADPSMSFMNIKQLEFVPYAGKEAEKALDRLRKHQIDLVIDFASHRLYYNPQSPASLMLRELFEAEQAAAARHTPPAAGRFAEQTAEGAPIRYVDWVVPGVIGMNMMFSCLFGVGWVIVRYRKNGVLKRLKATPVSAFTFVSSQAASRLIIVLITMVGVYAGTNAFLHFAMYGSYLTLLLIAFLGILCMISLGLVFAARLKNEELATGLMNLLALPMMILSGVFFSLEGAPPVLQGFSKALPLTQAVDAARSIMLEGAGLAAVLPNITYLAVASAAFLAVSSLLFRWE